MNIINMNIIYMLFAHYVLDYPLQGDFLAQTKSKYWYSLLAHSLIYGLGMSILFNYMGVLTIPKILILVNSHLIIDFIKANAKNKDNVLTTYLYLDQGLHILINLALMYLL